MLWGWVGRIDVKKVNRCRPFILYINIGRIIVFILFLSLHMFNDNILAEIILDIYLNSHDIIPSISNSADLKIVLNKRHYYVLLTDNANAKKMID